MQAALFLAAKAAPAVPAEMRLLVLLGGVVVVMIVVALVKASSSAAKKEESRRRSETNVAVAKAFWTEAEARGGLPPVQTTLMMKPGEQAYFSEEAQLFEPRSVRTGTGNRIGFRLAKGVWLSTGTSTYESTDVWKGIDQGVLTITNRRIVFDGQMGSRNLELAKLVSVTPFSDGIEVSVENRQKSSGFKCASPMKAWVVANACARLPDPGKFGGSKLEIDFG